MRNDAGSSRDRLAIRVISLPGSVERRQRMRQQLDPLGLPWSFFDARTGAPETLRYDASRARVSRGRELTPGEIGCFASHWALWEWLVASTEHETLLVLEDDLLIDPVFFGDLPAVLEELRPYEYMRLYAKVPAGIRHEALFLHRHVARFRGKAYGTQAYFIKRAAASRFLGSIRCLERPIDDEMDRFWAHGVPIRAIFPFPVMEIQYGSTIEASRRVLAPLRGTEKVRWIAERVSERLRRQIAGLPGRA
jgi:glycosyl transferase family 25